MNNFEVRAKQLDDEDTLASVRSNFILSDDEVYLDGNSLGPLTRQAQSRMTDAINEEWGNRLIRSWNEKWIELPQATGKSIALLIGASEKDVICADSVSVNIFKLLAASLTENPSRTTIVSVKDMFPTDLYISEGLSRLLGQNRCQLLLTDIDDLAQNLDTSTNVLLMSQVNFRTGEAYDVNKITALAHSAGARVLWDVSHSVGVLPIELEEHQVDFAVGCGYKFLNGGPGAPAFVYVTPELQDKLHQPLSGWMGHKNPFDFSPQYQRAEGMDHFLSGTPGILGLSALHASLEIWQDITLNDVFEKSQKLTKFFIEMLEASDHGFEVLKPMHRGSQVSIAHESAFPITQALIESGIICDFRAPNLMRFGFAPLYIRYSDVVHTVEALNTIMKEETYKQDRFQISHTVT